MFDDLNPEEIKEYEGWLDTLEEEDRNEMFVEYQEDAYDELDEDDDSVIQYEDLINDDWVTERELDFS
jgi:arginyl-tRNA--protein-N-Asp/Glu arginylyltransferase